MQIWHLLSNTQVFIHEVGTFKNLSTIVHNHITIVSLCHSGSLRNQGSPFIRLSRVCKLQPVVSTNILIYTGTWASQTLSATSCHFRTLSSTYCQTSGCRQSKESFYANSQRSKFLSSPTRYHRMSYSIILQSENTCFWTLASVIDSIPN